jgi:hypothetical protein
MALARMYGVSLAPLSPIAVHGMRAQRTVPAHLQPFEKWFESEVCVVHVVRRCRARRCAECVALVDTCSRTLYQSSVAPLCETSSCQRK